MKYTDLPNPKDVDGQAYYITSPPNRAGFHYSDGKKWKKFEEAKLNLDTKLVKFTDGRLKQRQVKLNIDDVTRETLRTIFMPNKDIYLGDLLTNNSYTEGNQFSWIRIQSSETLTIPQRRLMVVQGTMLIEGTLILKGELATL